MTHGHLPHDHGQPHEALESAFQSGDAFEPLAALFGELGDASRLRIFWMLCHCEECVINLSAIMDMSSPAVSHHLRRLKAAGLIQGRRDGKEVYYSAVDCPSAKALHDAIEQLMEIRCPLPPTE